MRPQESFIGQPIRSLQTMLRAIAEEDPGYRQIVPDGIYGPETVSAVTVFQKRHGLPATGITDQATWEAVAARYEPARISRAHAHPLHILLNPGQILRRGERHPHLYLVQGMLTALAEAYGSIPSPAATGILDDATADALAAFQQLSRLPMTGHLDKVTWKHLALQYPLAAEVLISIG
ncbi:MAG: peptidoglycan-binding protein [Oscillospiraceae bacterium]|nr:peptidoglycan-binding protein [Oscillospiraceae bacterium]MBQ7129532.1 peptidoglycan-binding protein [Oscillospiraceae bacterium]